MLRRIALSALLLAFAVPSAASLPVGTKAPDFTTRGAIGGKVFKVHLAEQLKKGPVVLYFFPKVFTSGCTAEANAFAEATAEFRKAGATVIGMSADTVPELQKFSVEACRSKFAVASAGPQIIKDFDVALTQRPGMTDRTSYVIAPTGRVAFVHSDMKPNDHVRLTLAAVQQMTAR
jgi:thioredoxin-dependent peroxiredoxin